MHITIKAIEHTHNSKGNPTAINHFQVDLNSKQTELSNRLPFYDSQIIVPKKSVTMRDLSALTAKNCVEYAMFTKGNERLIIRGDAKSVNISPKKAKILAEQGYRWSGHTHITKNDFQASYGDYEVLAQFNQDESVIYDNFGHFNTFKNYGRLDLNEKKTLL
jgi:hypothetical protein